MRYSALIVGAITLVTLGCGEVAREYSFCNKHKAKYFLQEHLKPDICQKIKVIPVPKNKGVFVAICEFQPDWWSNFYVFGCDNNTIKWTAKVQNPPLEQSISSVRPCFFPKITEPIIEVIGLTHAGNGFLYLYRLDNHKLTLLLKTKVIDTSDDGTLIRGEKLNIAYKDLNNNGYNDIKLSGIIDYYNDNNEDLNNPDSSKEYQATFFWDNNKKLFIQQRMTDAGIYPSTKE